MPTPRWSTDDGATRGGIRLLAADAGLARSVPAPVRERLLPVLRVGVESLSDGIWRPADLPGGPSMLGLLVLDGLLIRDMTVADRRCSELLGPGDVLRPWPNPEGGSSVEAEHAWRVVDGPVRIAVLDHRATLIIGRFPSLMAELLERTLTRARALQFQLALTQVHGIAQRLELLLWHAADRWGTVTVDGVVLPLNLTHEMLGRLVGARRPSVTTALRQLADEGKILRHTDGWLLRGTPVVSPLPLAV